MLIPSDSHDQFSDTNHEAERFVQSALDALSAHVAILDEQGGIIGVNAAWRQFADDNGFQDNEYGIGTNYLQVCERATLHNSKDAPIVALGIRDIISGKLNEFEMEYPCHSPLQRRWFVVRVSRFDWYKQMRLIVAHQNVTELKQVQIELSESKRRIEAVLDNINNGIITVDPKGVIETTNRAAARIFGYSMDELIGSHMAMLITEPFQGRATFRRLNGEYGHEITGRRKDGSTFPMYFSLNELQLDDGSLYTCIIQDITYRKRMEAEIIERERVTVALEKERELLSLKDRFLQMISHELKTPLASISLSYDMLKKYKDVSTDEENDLYLENIQQQVHHLRDVVDDVLTLSRSQSKTITLEWEDVDLITYCRDVIEQFQFAYHRTHQLEFDTDQLVLRADIDRRLLRRALTNLISNAIKYSPDGGRVLMHLSTDGEIVTIEVSDVGIGIPEDDQPRLFEPFHRAANVDALPGTGLGLAITQQMVDLHGGTIDFSSQTGVGTSFYIHLPVHQSTSTDIQL